MESMIPTNFTFRLWVPSQFFFIPACYQWNYDRWPYGIGSFSDKRGRYIPYALRDGPLGVERARRLYPKLHVVYMVGQNDTCNDGLPTCDSSCWKRNEWDKSAGEAKCWRNHMDIRCPAMLQVCLFCCASPCLCFTPTSILSDEIVHFRSTMNLSFLYAYACPHYSCCIDYLLFRFTGTVSSGPGSSVHGVSGRVVRSSRAQIAYHSGRRA